METTKIHLSADELSLIHNEEWILTKNRVIEKITHAMGQLGMQMQSKAEEKKHQIIHELLLSNPKISKGEKYQGLPYIILDYPRNFEKENIFAIRTFFWWGNFCSITLHVNGRYKDRIFEKLVREYAVLQRLGFYLSISGNEWNHDLRTGDYRRLETISLTELDSSRLYASFIKVGAKVELGQWNKMETELYHLFLVLLTLAEI